MRAGCAVSPPRASACGLVGALLISAYLTASAMGSSSYWWLGWITLLPLFHAIRNLRPTASGLAGAMWGAALFGSAALIGNSPIESSAASLAMLTAVPALYGYLGAVLTRRVGFSPYLLALGWVGVELSLQPLGLHFGLLAATQGDGFALRIVGSFAGYVLVAFLVAYFNAALLSAIAEVAESTAAKRRFLRGAFAVRCLLTYEFVVDLHEFLRQANPRGPPALAFATVRGR